MLWIALFAVAYVVVTAVALILLTAAKRADAEAQRQHEELVRSLRSKPPPVLVADDEPRREMVVRRLAR